MKIKSHLTFSGNCRQAFERYHAIFGGSLRLLSYADSPAANHIPAAWKSKIVHATLALADSELAGADVLPDDYKVPQGFYILFEPRNPDEARRVFIALSENGDVHISLQAVFWSTCYGKLVDQFGTPWEISCTETPAED